MKSLRKTLLFVLAIFMILLPTGCSSAKFAKEGDYIIEAKNVSALLGKGGSVLVDMQKAEDYAESHIKGSVNIPMSDIVVNTPVDNMLAPKEQIEEVLGKNGISNDTTIVVYDTANNMQSARFWWTLKVYGSDNVKVVSGGLSALRAAGMEMTNEKPQISPAQFTAKEKDTSMIATIDDVKQQVNNPDKNTVLLDTRSLEEYNQGTIPGSMLLDYMNNNYNDGTYKSVQNIRIQYVENNIRPEDTVIMYCKTSIRGAQTYLALYNAGYRNLKLYDGAWLEWTSDKSLPVQTPTDSKVEPSQKDNS
jgi:thiosulfate/3-mercaptopyruvate sulfurtransferase